jgi:hypothetical protein
MSFSDLPVPVVQLISRYARGRKIAGSNKYARVCRQWRSADSQDADKPLQLYVNLRHMSEADTVRAFDWMAVHGQHVDALVLQACMKQGLPLDLFSRAAPSLSNLTWLDVVQRHSLVLLAPVLGQLPQLKHLGAAVDMGRSPDQAGDGYVSAQEQLSIFLDDSGQPWEEVPDLQQLCPQLEQLDLTINAHRSRHYSVPTDGRLPLLLPPGLQQLSLTSDWEQRVRLVAASVQHLTALQQLTLDGVEMEVEDASMVMQSLGALQEVRVFSGRPLWQNNVLIQLAPKLTACWYEAAAGVEVLPQLKHLTLLMLSWRDATHGMPEGTVEALAALTGLQALKVEGDMEDASMGQVLQQVADMSALRSLRLAGNVGYGTHLLGEGLEQCTQLTALELMVLINPPGGPYARRRGPRHFVPAPEQLTGLRRLAFPGDLLVTDDGVWLAPMVHLTSLCLRVWPGPVRYAVVEGPVCRVQDWSDVWEEVVDAGNAAGEEELFATLQRVNANGHRVAVFGGWGGPLYTAPPQTPVPTHWQVTPAVPGAAPITVYTEEEEWLGHGRSQPVMPCPHLPGVWELQGEVAGSGYSRSMLLQRARRT